MSIHTEKQRRRSALTLTLLVAAATALSAGGSVILLQEDFDDGIADGWDLSSGGSDAVVEDDGSGSNQALAITQTQTSDSETGLVGMVAATPVLDLSLRDWVTFSFEITANEDTYKYVDELQFFNGAEWLTFALFDHTSNLIREYSYTLTDSDVTFTANNRFRFIPQQEKADPSKQYYDNVEVMVNPEPASLALLVLGGSLGLLRRRRRRR